MILSSIFYGYWRWVWGVWSGLRESVRKTKRKKEWTINKALEEMRCRHRKWWACPAGQEQWTPEWGGRQFQWSFPGGCSTPTPDRFSPLTWAKCPVLTAHYSLSFHLPLQIPSRLSYPSQNFRSRRKIIYAEAVLREAPVSGAPLLPLEKWRGIQIWESLLSETFGRI